MSEKWSCEVVNSTAVKNLVTSQNKISLKPNSDAGRKGK